ncbi:hypothetical protein ACFRAQ_34660 [Nocardia sp. NPDC056611]|uniref:hypothetical protein n=1 Tax=Nocardia sp. NPDC056611 TaxID=3345877 RepID=UPI003671E2D4
MKFGKLPAREGAVKLKLANYLDAARLPTPPPSFGHENASRSWGMLANDRFGDCVFAGAAHETMLWAGANGRAVSFTDSAVLSDYSAVTGFDPADPSTDQGTDVAQALSYRRKVGVVDAAGRRHKVAAYAALEPGNVRQLIEATYLFGAVGVGIEFPSSAMDQFNAGKPWSIVRGARSEGGHYVPVVGYRDGYFDVLTWGKVQQVSRSFMAAYCDEAYALFSEEYLTSGKSPEGFLRLPLVSDLVAVTRLD